MSKLHIPRLGTEIVLAEDWTFQLFDEHRNEGLIAAAGIATPSRLLTDFWGVSRREREAAVQKSKWRKADGSMPDDDRYYQLCHPVTIPAGAVFSIDRIFIRKGAADFDSVTFWLKAKQNPVTIKGRQLKKSVRFWAKLDDVNRIEVWESTP